VTGIKLCIVTLNSKKCFSCTNKFHLFTRATTLPLDIHYYYSSVHIILYGFLRPTNKVEGDVSVVRDRLLRLFSTKTSIGRQWRVKSPDRVSCAYSLSDTPLIYAVMSCINICIYIIYIVRYERTHKRIYE